MRYSARDLALGGLFGALGVALPMLFHLVGLGKEFLPMHLPVLVCGLLVAPPVAFAVGFVTPLISSVITGMPPLVPIALLMTLDLGVLAVVASCARRRLRLPVIAAVIAAMVAARLIGAMEMVAVAPMMGLRQDAKAYLAASILTSWPGLALQLIAVPPTVAAVARVLSTRTPIGKDPR